MDDYDQALTDGFAWLCGWNDEGEHWIWEFPTSDDAFTDSYSDFYEDRDAPKVDGVDSTMSWPVGS